MSAQAARRFFPFNLVLPNMPGVAAQLVKSFNDDRVGLGELAELIGQDPALSAKVLRLANSARYSPLRSVSSLREAAASLGMTMLRNLSLATSLSGAFPRAAGLDPDRFWRHAMTSAQHAVLLSRGALLDADTAYLGGLMLRTGQLLMAQIDKAGVAEVEQSLATPGGRFAAEQARWQCSHADVTAELARRWQFPDTLVAAFQASATPLQAQPYTGLGTVLHLAEALADAVELGLAPEAALSPALTELLARLRIKPEWLIAQLAEAASPDEELALMR
ncbi:HDOD domain-containing protein [Ideonella alba]|uniref:HDOD domain-containing protein n=1 Tax=Ideonella alba TaxID=2824118 RepID=A0A941BEL9_9BURK|nr:HDOD domain-containing protein [Ideonella alba]MBQ0930107.1 HDOD domain-containing protein [Ideonella alba]